MPRQSALISPLLHSPSPSLVFSVLGWLRLACVGQANYLASAPARVFWLSLHPVSQRRARARASGYARVVALRNLPVHIECERGTASHRRRSVCRALVTVPRFSHGSTRVVCPRRFELRKTVSLTPFGRWDFQAQTGPVGFSQEKCSRLTAFAVHSTEILAWLESRSPPSPI